MIQHTPRRIALYGGSFDPIHFGHLISARAIGEALGLERIILFPSARPPHKQGAVITAAEHRLKMAQLAVAGEGLFEVSDLELKRPGPSYTFDTVTQMQQQLGESVRLYWIIGADSLPELPTWSRIDQLVHKVQIVTTARPGWRPPSAESLAPSMGMEAAEALLRHCIATPCIDISSTEIRRRVAAGLSIKFLATEAVTSYIQAQKLYL